MGAVLQGESMTKKVRHIRPSRSPPTSDFGGGNGGGIEGRLGALEVQVARIDERIIGLEKKVATKASVLGGVVMASVIGIGIALAAIKLIGA